MGTKLHGIPVQIEVKTQTNLDGFKRPVYSSVYQTVNNVLVGRPSSEEQTETLNITGKRIEYWLGIPKGDTNDWKDVLVKLPAPFSCTVKTFGFVETGIQDLIPMTWGSRVAAELFE